MASPDRRIVLIVLFAVVLSMAFMRTTRTFYTSDANVYYRSMELMMNQQDVSSNKRHKGWIKLNDTYYPAMPIGYSVLAMPAAAATSSLSLQRMDQIEMVNGVHPVTASQLKSGYWVEDGATYRIRVREPGKYLNFFFQVRTLFGTKNLTVTLDGETVYTGVHGRTREKVGVFAPVSPGTHLLRFQTEGDCERVSDLYPFLEDDRCLAFTIDNIFANIETPVPVTLEERGTVWVNRTPTKVARIVNWEQYKISRHLELQAWPMDGEGSVSLAVLNGTVNRTILNRSTVRRRSLSGIRSYDLPTAGRLIMTPAFPLRPGNNTVVAWATGCGDGEQCVTGVTGVTVPAASTFVEDNLQLTGTWYRRDMMAGVRWTGGRAGVIARTSGRRNALLFAARSYRRPRTVTVDVNGKRTRKLIVRPTWTKYRIELPDATGRVNASFNFSPPCQIPAAVGVSEDIRCLGIAFRNLRVN